MDQLKNKTFNGIYRISIWEDGNLFILEDSIILKGHETFQLLTTQKGLDILKIENHFHIDGEYYLDHIDLIPIVEETIYIHNVLSLYDKNIDQITIFSLQSDHNDYFFTRSADEIHRIQKHDFERLIPGFKT